MVLGADDYITKPFEPRELVESIAGVLAKRETLSDRLKHYTDEYHREMAAPWAHELLTPLNGILGIAAMLESEAGSIPPADLRDLARSISQSARRQQGLEVPAHPPAFVMHNRIACVQIVKQGRLPRKRCFCLLRV